MPIFQQPQTPTPISAFQAPPTQSAFVPSATTSQMLAGDSGTPFDILANLGFGIQRQQAEQKVADQLAAEKAAATQLEAERFKIGQEGRQATAQARVDAAALTSEQAVEAAKVANRNKVEAARLKREADKEAAALLRQQKIAEAKAKKTGKKPEKITRTTTIAEATENELKIAGDLVEALDPAFEGGFFDGNKKELARSAAAEAKAIQAQAAAAGSAISFPQAMRQYYQTGTQTPTPEVDATGAPQQIGTQAEYDALPSGTIYVDSKGTQGTKP